MKVLQVNVVYKTGSTGGIVYDIHRKLEQQGISSVVCYGRGKAVAEAHVHQVCGELYSHINHAVANGMGVVYGGCRLSTHRLITIMKREKPDVVHLHCLNGYFVNIYRLLNWLKENHMRTVLTLHAEFMYTGGCSSACGCLQWMQPEGCGQLRCPRYRSDMKAWFFDRSRSMWQRMKRAFEGFGDRLRVVSVSPWLMQRAAASPILGGMHHSVVLNGVDTSHFRPCSREAAKYLRQELGLGERRVIFHATAAFSDEPGHLKGGYYLVELARRLPEVAFVVAGQARVGMTLPENIKLLGQVSDKERLAQLYSMADLTVITSRQETFSMVAAESLCCGTPVAGFRAGGPEMIALPAFSAFAEQGDTASLAQIARDFLAREFDAQSIAEQASETYSRESMVMGYQTIYTSLVNDTANE